MKTNTRYQGAKSQRIGTQDLSDVGFDLKHHLRQIRLDRLLARQR